MPDTVGFPYTMPPPMEFNQGMGALRRRIETLEETVAELSTTVENDLHGWDGIEYLGADWTNSTLVGTDIFAGFTPAAGVEYEVEVNALVDTAVSTTAMQLAVAAPAAPQRFGFRVMMMSAQSTLGPTLLTAPSTFQASPATLVGNPSPLTIVGRCRWTAPGAGNVKLQGRSEVDTSQVTMYARSYFRWRALP